MSTLPELRDAIENGGSLRASAERTLAEYPQLGVGEEDLTQLLRAFSSLMLESLDGGGDTRALFLETAIPAYLEQGAPATAMIGSNVYFAVDVSGRLLAALPEGARAEASDWLTAFWASYIGDVASVVMATEGRR